MTESKNTILILSDYYLPAFKAGGAASSMASLVNCLGKHYRFKIVTGDRDLGDKKPYKNVKRDQWQQVGNAKVFYASPENTHLFALKKIISEIDYDVLYLVSFFSPRFTIGPILLRRLGLLKKGPTIISIRGQFNPEALKIKRFKKSIFLYFAKTVDLYKNCRWHATSKNEIAAINRTIGEVSNVHIAHELYRPPQIIESSKRQAKTRGSLSVIFLSRISPMKNLIGALDILSGSREKILFHIYGPVESACYWQKCLDKIEQLPENIIVEYHGSVESEDVVKTFSKHHLFLLPTLGENFGYVILESLLAGCPVLLSDAHPWKDINEAGVGWTFPNQDHEAFREVLHQMVNMDNEEFQRMAMRAQEYGLKHANSLKPEEQYRKMFAAAIQDCRDL